MTNQFITGCIIIKVGMTCFYVQAKMRNRTAGLGLKGSDYGATAGDSERDLLKKMVRFRCLRLGQKRLTPVP